MAPIKAVSPTVKWNLFRGCGESHSLFLLLRGIFPVYSDICDRTLVAGQSDKYIVDAVRKGGDVFDKHTEIACGHGYRVT